MNLKTVHKKCFKNKDYIQASRKVGCFCCLKTFKPEKIVDWADKNETALCPHCGTDSVIPDSVIDLSKKLLEELNLTFFKKTVT